MKQSVKAECNSCKGTGLYHGFCEANGEAVVCLGCDGTGCATITYTPFTKRHGKRGIKVVRRSRGTFIATGVGGHGESVTYAEFQEGKMPKGGK
jgi:hypothetical protein